MISLLGLLLALSILFGMAYILVEQWDQLKWQMLVRAIITLVFFGAVAYGVRYWLVIGVSCLPDCVGANLVGRTMRGARLDGANLVNANLSRTDLAKAHLYGADLSGALLVRVNLEGADLRNARLLGANLEHANLAGGGGRR